MRILASVLVLLFLITGGYGSCSSSQEVEDYIMFYSPGYPEKRSQHSCRKYRATYKSPPGTTLSIACPDFSIQCRGQSNYLLVTGRKKECGRSFPKATTSKNVLKLEYTARFNRAPASSKRTVFMFKCKIEVRYPKPSFSSCDCHVQEPAVGTRIALGISAEKDEFPYMVAMLENDNLVCGGSLITEKLVLTSASCDISTRHQVRMGFVSLRGVSRNEEYRNVKSVTFHPGYNPKNQRYGVVLVELDKPVEFSSSIQPICLPDGLEGDPLFSEPVIAAGWGANESDELPDVLHKLYLKVLNYRECHYKFFGSNLVFEEMMCAKLGYRDICKYDEGGPLLYTRDGKVYLVGVAALTKETCNYLDQPTYYIRISNHRILSWIRDSMDEQCEKKATIVPYSCDVCGEKMANFQQTRIYGGMEAKPGEFPFQVILATDSTLYCGGSLISHSWVLTAAHCKPNKYLDSVILGDFDRKNDEDPNRQVRGIVRIVNHPKYNEVTFEYDVALVELQKYVDFTDYIRPICLPERFTEESFEGKQGIATGWGILQLKGEQPSILHKVTLDLISNEECKQINGENIRPNSICTFSMGKDACEGDFGGPLVYKQDGRYYQIGVTSWDYTCIGALYASVHTRISHSTIVSWIKKTAGITCDAP